MDTYYALQKKNKVIVSYKLTGTYNYTQYTQYVHVCPCKIGVFNASIFNVLNADMVMYFPIAQSHLRGLGRYRWYDGRWRKCDDDKATV